MKTYEIEAMNIIIECKTDIGNRTTGFRASKAGLNNIFQAERRNPDMGVVQDIANVIQYERRRQGIGINQDDNDCQQR